MLNVELLIEFIRFRILRSKEKKNNNNNNKYRE